MSSKALVRHTDEELKKIPGMTAWDRLNRETASGLEPDISHPDDSEATDAEFAAAITRRLAGRPVSVVHKTPVSIRLSEDVVAFFRAGGKGWQSRVNNALKDWIKEHKHA